MKQIIFGFCFLFFGLSIFAQNSFLLQGKIVDQANQAIRDVNIINRSAKHGLTSDSQGSFQIVVSEKDSLLATCIGYKPFHFIAPNKSLLFFQEIRIVLISDTIFLQETVIRPFPATWIAFKKEAVELKIAEAPISKEFDVVKGPVYSAQGGIVLPGPVSILYSLFSKEAKQVRKMEGINHFEQLRNTLYAKVPKETMKKHFHIESELELDDFLFFCNLPESFITRAPAYDIITKLTECYAEFSRKSEK